MRHQIKGWVAVLQTLKRNGWTARVRTWFPDREFFMRSQGQVRFIKVSARLQMTAAAIVAGAVLAWLVVMIAMIFIQFASTSQRMAMLEREAKVTSAETRVSSYRKDIDHVAAPPAAPGVHRAGGQERAGRVARAGSACGT